MNLGVIALVLSMVCLLAGFAFGLGIWINVVGMVLGVAGLILLGRGRTGGGA